MAVALKPDWYQPERSLHAELQAALDVACPNYGVSIGRWYDRATWRVDFRPEATETQMTAAAGVILSFKLQDAYEDLGVPRILV